MNPDFIFALYVFCANYHSGQWSRGYRIMSRIQARGIHISDSAFNSIQGNRHCYGRKNVAAWAEWETARTYYRQLKRKFAGKV